MATKTTALNTLLTLATALLAAMALSAPAGADDRGYAIAEASAIVEQIVPDTTCLFDAGSLAHPDPIAACRAHAILHAGR